MAGLAQWAYRNHPDRVRIFQLIRYEVRGVIAHWRGLFSLRQRGLIGALKAKKGLRLNIANGGVKREGWIGLDAADGAEIKMDLRKPLPITDGSVRYIFCEHFCDHLSYPVMIRRFLAECYRVLERGGVARFVMHDARDLARAYAGRDSSYFELAEMGSGSDTEAVNMLYRFNDFHQFPYDYERFEALLREAGFSAIERSAYRTSAHEGLALDVVHESRRVMSMYIEAVK